MYKLITMALSVVVLILACLTGYFAFKYSRISAPDVIKVTTLTNELVGAGKVILAEQKVYNEYSKNKKFGFSNAKLLFRWFTTYQYMVDLQDSRISVSYDGSKVSLKCPQIQLNEPIVDISTYRPAGLVLSSGILIDETRVINEEFPEFKSKSLIAGEELRKDPRIKKICIDQLKLIIYRLASSMKLRVDDVIIEFV